VGVERWGKPQLPILGALYSVNLNLGCQAHITIKITRGGWIVLIPDISLDWPSPVDCTSLRESAAIPWCLPVPRLTHHTRAYAWKLNVQWRQLIKITAAY
jgi:hypothetical protein